MASITYSGNSSTLRLSKKEAEEMINHLKDGMDRKVVGPEIPKIRVDRKYLFLVIEG